MPLTPVTVICSLSIWMVSPVATDELPPVFVTWIVVSFWTLYTVAAGGGGPAEWAASMVPLMARVTERFQVWPPMLVTVFTCICSLSIWIVSPAAT